MISKVSYFALRELIDMKLIRMHIVVLISPNKIFVVATEQRAIGPKELVLLRSAWYVVRLHYFSCFARSKNFVNFLLLLLVGN